MYIQPRAMGIFLVHELTKMVGRCYAGFLYSCLMLFYATKTMAYSSGAPSMTSVCEERQPLHRSGEEIIQPQIGAPSISMATDVSETSGGSVIKVTLKDEKTSFKGFLMEAVLDVEEKQSELPSSGEFLPSEEIKQVQCSWNQRIVTHSSSTSRQHIALSFRVPNTEANIRFRATVVQSYNKYWMNISSPVVSVKATNVTMSGVDLSRKWLKSVVQIAKGTTGGTQQLVANIRSRFSTGFSGVLNKDNVMASKEILNSLPFKMAEKSSKGGSSQRKESSDTEKAVSELLAGNLDYTDTVELFLQ